MSFMLILYLKKYFYKTVYNKIKNHIKKIFYNNKQTAIKKLFLKKISKLFNRNTPTKNNNNNYNYYNISAGIRNR